MLGARSASSNGVLVVQAPKPVSRGSFGVPVNARVVLIYEEVAEAFELGVRRTQIVNQTRLNRLRVENRFRGQ